MEKKVCNKCGKLFFYDKESIKPTYYKSPIRSGDFSEYFMTPIQLLDRYKKMYGVYCPHCDNYIILEKENGDNE
ncbi:MAG: hypothetical protein J6J71_04770 [Prevotella sp.]|nr:hypothetical protein [Prevotella sp.]